MSVAMLRAQTIVSGTVTDSESGESIEGVAVLVKGTTIGMFTDASGKYALQVPAGGEVLVFTFVGKAKQEIAIDGRSSIDVVLYAEDLLLDEVVVTALGIKRQERALGYSVQELKGETANIVRQTDVSSALAGKISGIQVLGQSSAKFGTANIRVRGVNSITGGNPLYVVNGTPVDDAGAINMDDVENISVLKGPTAAALYGQRGQDGVILITTKSARNNGGIGLEVNSTTLFEGLAVMPRFQNEYGGGYTQDWSTFSYNPGVHPDSWAAFDGQKIVEYYADESWGPKLDGTLYRPWYSWYPGPDFGKEVAFSPQPDNVRDFYNTGVQLNNNIALSKSGENFSVRLSYTNVNHNGVVPNTFQGRDLMSANTRWDLNKRLSVDFNINYVDEETRNRPFDGYSNQTVGSFNQWFQRQMDLTQLKDYKNADGSFRSWNLLGSNDYDPADPTGFLRPLYWDNPYTEVYENIRGEKITRLYGNFGLRYKITDDLKISGIARRNLYNSITESRTASGTLNLDAFSTGTLKKQEDNYELLLEYGHQFGDFGLQASAGGNVRHNTVSSTFLGTVGGLTIPNLYNISASKDRPTTSNFFSDKLVRSVYALVGLSYKELLYLDGTIRNDWSSALPVDNNSYLYPSLSGSFIFSELTK
ncbi:MAG: SusC/RagA family TonB-linked outer membrane protein, partial [Bacteroidetes bacterium]